MASNSDNYEFAKSATPQSVSSYSAFSDKQYNFLNDVNKWSVQHERRAYVCRMGLDFDLQFQ